MFYWAATKLGFSQIFEQSGQDLGLEQFTERQQHVHKENTAVIDHINSKLYLENNKTFFVLIMNRASAASAVK